MATCIPRIDGLSTDPRVWGVTILLHFCDVLITFSHFLKLVTKNVNYLMVVNTRS